MLSRAAQLPRVCLACRLGMLRQAAAVPVRHPLIATNSQFLRYGSDFSPQSKERVEALISGALDDIESHSKKRGKGSRRSVAHDEPATWELEEEHESHPSKDGRAGFEEETSVFFEDSSTSRSTTNDELANEPETSHNPAGQRRTHTDQFRDKFVYRQSLGIDALGKPVDAIIMKNPNKMRFNKKKITQQLEDLVHADKPEDGWTWQSLVPKDSEIDEPAFTQNVEKVFEDMRPKDTTIIRRKDFDKLLEDLISGFTSEQLTTYRHLGKRGQIEEKSAEPSCPWLIKHSPWVATNPINWGRLTHKKQQAVAILKDMWKLEVQEHVEGLGRTDVWLRPDIFSLITKPRRSILGRLTTDFLDKSNDERVTLGSEQCRLSIYSRKSTVATFLARLDETAQTVQSTTLSVQQIEPENLDRDVLDVLEKATKTSLLYDAANSKLVVSWLSKTGVSHEHTEGPADIVLRLLLGRESTPQNTDIQVLSKPKSKTGVFLTHQRDKRNMAWRDRLRQWSRYVKPIGKSTATSAKNSEPPLKVSFIKPELKSSNGDVEVTATFGHVLHTERRLHQIKQSKGHRVLAPVIPHPAALTAITADTPAPSTQKTAIVLNFAPEHLPGTSLPEPLPQIRLHLPVSPSADLSNFLFPDTSVLEAVIPLQETNMMLPSESVDVRITQKQLIPLDANQSSLQQFLQASDFNLLQGRLKTPSRTNFTLPGHLSTHQTHSAESVTHPYMFMGLDIHQTINMEWQSHTLRYSSIEAGQHGGQQQRLSLIAGPPNRDCNIDEEQFQSFLKLVEETAYGKHFSWDEGYKLMTQRSVEQFDWDMMDPEYQQEPSLAAETREDAPQEDSPETQDRQTDQVDMSSQDAEGDSAKDDAESEPIVPVDAARPETELRFDKL